MRTYIGVLVCWLIGAGLAVPGQAQKWIRGEVVEAGTGTPLGAATLQVEGTTRGTITNPEGRFELYVEALPATVVVRHIGYATQRVPVTTETPAEITVALTPVALPLEEVVVSGEDPAVAIMRQVLEKKQAWRAGLTSEYAEVYTRFMLYREDRLVQFNEMINAAYWRPGAGTRELIRARRIRPEGSGTFRFAAPIPVPNFYDDDVVLYGTRYIGPTHPEALDVYRFILGGTRRLDDQVVFDLYFTPRSRLRPAFVGHLAVLDSVFAVVAVDLRPEPPPLTAPPVLAFDVQFEQRFARVGPGQWVPVDLQARGQVRFGRAGVQYPRARFEQLSRRTLHAFNVPVPDSLFDGDRVLYVHPLADQQEYLFRWNPGLIPLTPREVEALVALPRRQGLNEAFRPSGMLRRYLALDVEEAPAATTPEEAPAPGPMARRGEHLWVWYNRVDGWHLGLRPRWRAGPLTATTGLAYDVDRERLAATGALRLAWAVEDAGGRPLFRPELEVGGSTGTAPRFASATYPRGLAGAAHYLGFRDYFDYYLRERVYGRAGVRLVPWSIGVQAGVTVERHRSARRQTDRKSWLTGERPRLNPPIEAGRLRALTLRLEGGALDRPGTAGVRLDVEHSPRGFLGSQFDYTTLRMEAGGTLPTFLRRRAWPNTLRLRLRAGTVRGHLPVQRFAALDGTLGPVAASGSFRGRRDRPYEGERYAALFWEHDFGTVPFEVLGLWGMVERGVGLALHGAHGRTWIDDARRATLGFPPAYQDGFHHELGLSLTHLFLLPVRLDLTYRLDRPGVFFTFGLAKTLR